MTFQMWTKDNQPTPEYRAWSLRVKELNKMNKARLASMITYVVYPTPSTWSKDDLVREILDSEFGHAS